MLNPLRTVSLSVKVALMGAGSVLFTAAALVLLSVWQSGQYNALAQGEVDALIEADLDHITQGVYQLVRTENEAVQIQVDGNLKVARHLLDGSGEIRLGEEQVAWTAINQFTKDATEVVLPAFQIDGRWIGKNRTFATESPVVDQITRLVGETATLFQRMNDRGDMLRIATTVKATSHERAISTYIPAVEPDGSANPVIGAVLKGQPYHGRAYVVNDWYLTAYEPIHDAAGTLVGMLYVGVRQEVVAARIREAILQTRVGKSGYVYILGGAGEDRGRYIISHRGERDGEDIWNSQDSDGRFVIREIVARATGLKPGEMTTVRYRWQNRGEAEPRWKIARLAYYPQWDWVIGTSVFEDELQAYNAMLSQGRARMIHIMIMAGGVITVLAGLVSMLIIWTMTRPIRRITEAAQTIIAGDFSRTVPVTSGDEIGVLAQTFNHMTDEIKRFTAGLRNSEANYRDIFEHALEGVYQSSLEGRFLKANPALARILGYDSPDELIAAIADIRHQFYVHPADRDTLLAAITVHRQAFGFETEVFRRDGSTIWVLLSARLRRDRPDDPGIIEGFIVDITTRKRAEEALAESRNFLDEIIDSFGDPMFVKDSRHRWVLLNKAFCAVMGRSRHQLLGCTDHDFFPPEEAAVFWTKDEEVLVAGVENINEEFLTDGQGVRRTIVTRRSLYVDKNGERYIVGIIRDITEQRRAEEERLRLEARLNRAEKMEAIGTLAGGIAHDFNNILQPMLGYSEMLCQRLPADSSVQRYAGRLHTAALRARELVAHILAFSRQAEHKVIAVRVQTILKEVAQLCRSTMPSNIAIQTEVDNACPPVLMDPSQLHQVAMNLVINAFHAMEATGGEIVVRLREEMVAEDDTNGLTLIPGRYVLLTVTDTGCGIDPAILDKVFDPYFTTKEQGKGTGLGLALVHGIVTECGGDVYITSELGKGTVVRVYLPVFEVAETSEELTPGPQFPSGSERILLVDDEEMIIEISTLLLTELGYRVTSCLNGAEALDLFKADADRFDLVITDMMMPQMTGEELVRQLLAIRSDMPVILCSGFSERMGQDQARAIGARALLMKPITFEKMACTVRMVLDEARRSP